MTATARRRSVSMVTIALGLALAGCSVAGSASESSSAPATTTSDAAPPPSESDTEPPLTIGELESSLAEAVKQPGVVVSCPDSAEIKRGVAIECTISGDNNLTGSVKVILASDDGRRYGYEGEYTANGMTGTLSGNRS